MLSLQNRDSIIQSMEQKDEKVRFCRKCLTSELAEQADTYRTIKEHVDNLDPDVRADQEQYTQRLDTCRQCEWLLEGMCRSCGCYVELRAAVIKNVCPRKKW